MIEGQSLELDPGDLPPIETLDPGPILPGPEPYSGEVWASMNQAPFWMYQGDNGNASCEVYWTVTATGVYY